MDILIIEDEDLIAELETDIISQAFPELKVARASSGINALSMLHDNALPKVVILDINLGRIDGLDLFEHLYTKEKIDRTSIIVVSAYGDDKNMEKAKSLEVKRFLQKPFEAEHLIENIRQILAK